MPGTDRSPPLGQRPEAWPPWRRPLPSGHRTTGWPGYRRVPEERSACPADHQLGPRLPPSDAAAPSAALLRSHNSVAWAGRPALGAIECRSASAGSPREMTDRSRGRSRMPVVRSTADTCAGTTPNHFCANAATGTPQLDRIRRDLGLPEGCRLKAQLRSGRTSLGS